LYEGGKRLLGKVLGWIVVVVVVVFIISNPAQAGALVNDWIHAIITFFTQLAGGSHS